MSMRYLLLAGLLLVATSPAVRAADADSPGRAAYLRYCGACHGPEGKGDGVAGTFIRPKPTNLTRIAKTNAGKFPFQRVMDVIDGRRTVRAHGDPDMPVWGEIFREEAPNDQAARAEVAGKVMLLTEYIQSIQGK